jgi:hypothetical protein
MNNNLKAAKEDMNSSAIALSQHHLKSEIVKELDTPQ